MYEISRKIINISKYEETDITWNNSVIVVQGNKDLHLVAFSYNLQSFEKKIEFTEHTISCIKDNPVINNYLSDYVSNGVENIELVEMVTNSSFWPHNRLLMQEMTKIISYQWSPCDLINNNESVLAVVNSVGIVEFFGLKRSSWTSLLNFSLEMTKKLNLHFPKLKKHRRNFQELKENVYGIETATLCWSPELNEDNSCYLVTAQKSGRILFWSVKYSENLFETELCGSIDELNYIEIVTMKWIPMESNEFLLLCTNEQGQVVSHECKINNKHISLIKEHNIWMHKDKMVVTHLCYYSDQDKFLFFFNKHRHLIVQMYNRNLKLLSQHEQIVNDYKITCISSNKNNFYVTTFNIKIYKINYIINKDTLEVSLNAVETKDSYPNHELFGLAVSPNGAIIALALIGRQLLHRKELLKIEIVLLSSDASYDNDVLNIVNNPSKNIAHIWDYIEVVRCKIIKARRLPALDYDSLLKDGDSDVYKLKVYLIFLKFYHNLEKRRTRGLRGLMPETSIDTIKDKILLHQAVTQIVTLHDYFQTNGTLSSFEWECFIFSKKYLYHYCKKYKKSPTDFVSNDILVIHVLYNTKVKFFCQSCEEEILDFSCKNNHLNMFCMLTFSPIEDDYLFCKSCDTTARIALYQEKPTCVYCDLYLSKNILPS